MNKKISKPDLQAEFGEVLAAYQQQDFQTALAKAEDLLVHYPQQEAVLNLAGVILAQSGRLEEAVAMWKKIPSAKLSPAMLNNLGNGCRRLGDFAAAQKYLRQAVKQQPDYAEAWWNLTLTCNEAGQAEHAFKAVQALLKLKPKDEAALEYAAMLCFNRQDFAQADVYQTQLLALQPERHQLWLDNAWANRRLKRYAAAETKYRRALELKDDVYDAWFGLAKMCHFQQKYAAACVALERALKLQPDNIEAQSDLALNRLYLLGQAKQGAADSFRLGDLYAAAAENMPPPRRQPHEKLRIGLVSSDLRQHPVGKFAKGLLLSEAAKQFEWTAYANSDIFDAESQALYPAFSAWHKVKSWSDRRLIEQIRSDGIDILIDLNGHTDGHRLGVFAAQAAPVQAAWLGYFATTGLPTMQALIADPYCVPPEEESLYREKIYRLPHTRLSMRAPETAAAVNPLPALTNGYITFGCFQNLTKLNDDVLKTWAAVARRIPTAHWRFQTDRLKKGAERDAFKQKLLDLGFSDGMIALHGAEGYENYLAAHHEIDVILDTFPFPGGTTTVDSLWMGVPTLTLALEGMLARQGQQLMSAAGLQDWVCTRLEDYLLKAFYWADAQNWPQLAKLRHNLRAQVAESPVFDTETFARDWCQVIQEIWQDHQRDAV